MPRAWNVFVFVLITTATWCPAQVTSGPGPYAVAHAESTWLGRALALDESPPEGRLYLPFDPTGVLPPPPFPVVAFLHGYVGNLAFYAPDHYDALCTHIASWGFVVVAVGTQNGPTATPDVEADDAFALLAWAEGAPSRLPPLAGLIAPGAPIGVVGHSMGATASMFCTRSPRVEVVVAFEPYTGPAIDPQFFAPFGGIPQGLQRSWRGCYPALRDFDGALLIVSAGADEVLFDGAAETFFTWAEATRRKVHLRFAEFGHNGPIDPWDLPPPVDPTATVSQLRQLNAHSSLAVAMLLAELRSPRIENAWYDVVGPGLTTSAVGRVDVVTDCRSHPVIWTAPAPGGKVRVGTAGVAGASFAFEYSSGLSHGVLRSPIIVAAPPQVADPSGRASTIVDHVSLAPGGGAVLQATMTDPSGRTARTLGVRIRD